MRDRDSRYTRSFDAVFAGDGIEVILTPVRAPRADAFAERWVRTVRRECLDWTLILGRRHLERVIRDYVAHYNAGRPRHYSGFVLPIQGRTRARSRRCDRLGLSAENGSAACSMSTARRPRDGIAGR
ncbi:MAG: integrase core domain-containing protein [Actinomycetota bacterium]